MIASAVRLLSLLLIAAALLPGSLRPVLALDIQQFDQTFETILAEAGVPGGAYAIVRGAEIVQAAGYGQRMRGSTLAVTPETVFRVASVSKTFAAQLTALLVAEGRLAWDEPIVDHVPGFTLADPAHARALRIDHLLGQSAGIVPNAYDNLLNANQPLERILPQFATVQPLCRPGQCYSYQNVLFSLVEPALVRRAGQSYSDLLTERLFMPLEMTGASSGLDAFRTAPNRARPHVRTSRHLPWVPVEATAHYYRVAPAAGVNASVLDLGQWLIAQLGHRPDVIPLAQLEMLTEPRVRTTRELRRRGWRDLIDDAHYGLGWRIYRLGDETLYLHSGWVKGFVADIAYSRDRQLGLAVLLNAESGALNDITTAFWRSVFETVPDQRPGTSSQPISGR